MYRYFTSESVAAGHPDKICDSISDAIVDAALTIDGKSRVAVETLVTVNQVVLAGEVTCPEKIDYEKIARKIIRKLGYTIGLFNFSYKSPIDVFIHQQSPDISQGVDEGGAGDQGMMFGFAINETSNFMPMPITIAHELVLKMDQLRENKKLTYLRPDGKAEVVVEYRRGKPVEVPIVIMAVPHNPKISNRELVSDLRRYVVNPVLNKYLPNRINKKVKLVVNGTGNWEIGGPASDTGVTGRKIIVDTYGGMGRHGGGCFSGKDPTKVDRSGAYAARYIAKNIVAHRLADRCEVNVAYVIGQKEPVSVAIDTFGTNVKSDKIIESFANKILNLEVPNILEQLDLRRPIYLPTATYGHFGNDRYPWEKIASV